MLLGQKTTCPDRYSPDLLEAFPREDGRRTLGISDRLPFAGVDTWNAWEVTWLDARGKPGVAAATLQVPAESPSLVESKSVKLYLNSFAMTSFPSTDEVRRTVVRDLSRATGSEVGVELATAERVQAAGLERLPGVCIDGIEFECTVHDAVDPDLLRAADSRIVREELYTHLFRSNCPVTQQPDYGSILVRYHGPAMDRAALLQYLVSYRRHHAFHENCIERIFVDLKAACRPAELTVCGRFTRRGGIDINPFRSDFESRPPENTRLWRQ